MTIGDAVDSEAPDKEERPDPGPSEEHQKDRRGEEEYLEEYKIDGLEVSEYERRHIRDDEEFADVTLEDVQLPDIPPEDYGKVQRSAYLLRRLRDVGVPERLNITELSELFHVDRRTIRHDLENYVYEHVQSNLGKAHKVKSELMYSKLITKAMEEDNLREARKLVEKWNDWLGQRGIAEREPEKVVEKKEITDEDRELIDEMF